MIGAETSEGVLDPIESGTGSDALAVGSVVSIPTDVVNGPPPAIETTDDAEPPPTGTARDGAWRIVVPVPAEVSSPTFKHRDLGKPVAVWTYRDATGALLGYVCRFDREDGDKEFRPRTLWSDANNKVRWRWASWPKPRPLYALDKLAAQPQAVVVICEGEKAADAATELWPDCVGISPPHGATSPHLADWSPLAARRAVVWPDADVSGRAFALRVVGLARKAGVADVHVVDVPNGWPDGWDLADPAPDGYDAAVLRRLLDEAATSVEHGPNSPRDADDTATGVRYPFSRDADGVHYAVEDKDGGVTWERVCSPLDVLAVTRDSEAREYGRLLRIEHLDGGTHEWSMPMSMLAGDGTAYREQLLSLGLQTAAGRRARERLHEYIMTTLPPTRVRCVPRPGWHDDVYVLPDATFSANNLNERVILQTANGVDQAARTAGSLAEWQAQIATPCVGNTRLVFSLACAFAAPLLALTGDESGGFHLRGRSSTGKTTALRVAASAWGSGGDRGYLQTWRATSNGLESIATAHNDALLCLDELGQVAPRDAGEVAYMLANGTGKRRARGDGTGRRPASWRVLWLSTGELALADKMREAGLRVRAGQDVRLVEIPADAGAGFGLFERLHEFADGATFSRHLRDATARFYGVASREFLARLAAERDQTASVIEQGRRQWVREHCPPGADGQVERVADRFGLVAAAGELASYLRILPWDEGEAAHAAAACFTAWLAVRGSIGPAELAAGIAQVRSFIMQHGPTRFARTADDLVRDRAGFLHHKGQEVDEYQINPEVWRDEVCRGYDAHAIAEALAETDDLVRDSNGKLQAARRVEGMPQARYYVLRAAILGEAKNA